LGAKDWATTSPHKLKKNGEDANLYLTEACVHIAICRCRQQSCFETAWLAISPAPYETLNGHMDVIIIFTMDSSRITT
jgi:hypothetical protein